jgi:hypothetical protein
MQRSGPSLAPSHDAATYLVLDEFPDGRVFRETDEAEADRETVIEHIVSGQYKKPVRVIAFNTAECWARDVTEDIAREIVDNCEPLTNSAPDSVTRQPAAATACLRWRGAPFSGTRPIPTSELSS